MLPPTSLSVDSGNGHFVLRVACVATHEAIRRQLKQLRSCLYPSHYVETLLTTYEVRHCYYVVNSSAGSTLR